MTVDGFGLFAVDDPHDMAWDCDICWSRVYEYTFAISRMSGSVHNTSWGFRDIHVVFKEWLDGNVDDVLHSDRLPSELPNTATWDVTTPPPDEWVERFDTVLSISTLEEVRNMPHTEIITDRLLPQVKPGGRLIVTFDVPGFQVDEVEGLLGVGLTEPAEPLTPVNSVSPGGAPARFRVGYLVIQK